MPNIMFGEDLVKLLLCIALQCRGLTDEEREFLNQLEHQYFYEKVKE